MFTFWCEWKILEKNFWMKLNEKMKIEKIFLGGVWIYQNLKSDFISSDHSQGHSQKLHILFIFQALKQISLTIWRTFAAPRDLGCPLTTWKWPFKSYLLPWSSVDCDITSSYKISQSINKYPMFQMFCLFPYSDHSRMRTRSSLSLFFRVRSLAPPRPRSLLYLSR